MVIWLEDRTAGDPSGPAGPRDLRDRRRSTIALAGLALAPLFFLACRAQASGPTYDLVLSGGRVMDPETGLDAVRNVGIRQGRIEAVTARPLSGRDAIDAAGLVVAPGFIDLHSHGHDPENYRLQALDGVTATMDLEIGAVDVPRWYAERAGKSSLHHGVAVGHAAVRMRVMGDPPAELPSSQSNAARREASREELERIRRGVEEGLGNGALAVGMVLQYTPAASRWEVLEVFRTAARFGATSHVHLRYMGHGGAGALAGLQEAIANSAVAGCALHVLHVTSNGLDATDQLLAVIDEARARGLDVTTEAYPYAAAVADIGSPLFDDGWPERLRISHADLEWVATGERLTEATFARYRRTGGLAIAHMIPERAVAAAMKNPAVIVASDGAVRRGRGHPRTAGTFSRLLGRLARERGELSVMQALLKSTLLPARRIEKRVPAMRRKGRLQEGADADITVFHPGEVLDRATYQRPDLPSAGIRHVIVGGTPIVRDGAYHDLPAGRAIRAATSEK
jgi:N-acyl-D-aspartate/D-glutamate deacylase